MIETQTLWQRVKALYALRNEPECARPLAEMIWRAILSLLICAVVLIVAFGVWEFWSVLENLNASNAASGKPPAVLNRGNLEKVLSAVNDRADSFNSYKMSPKTYTDPSR